MKNLTLYREVGRMYKPLAHSTSADSHSGFMRLRVRFDSSQVAYVVHNANGLYRGTRAETGWIRHACASSDNVEQRGAVSRRLPKKSFRTCLRPRSKKGGAGHIEGKNRYPKIASPIGPCRVGPSQESGAGALSIATSQIDAMAARNVHPTRRKRCSWRACSGPSA